MNQVPAWRFVIAGTSCPQLPLRLLGLFAQQDLIPSKVMISCSNDELEIVIVQAALDPQRAEIIANKMRALVMVQEVRSGPDAQPVDPKHCLSHPFEIDRSSEIDRRT